MGHVILGLEHVSTGNWKHETRRLLDIPGGLYQVTALDVGICMIYVRLQDTVVWLFMLRQDRQITTIYLPTTFQRDSADEHVDAYRVFSTHGHIVWLHDGRSAART